MTGGGVDGMTMDQSEVIGFDGPGSEVSFDGLS